MTRVCDALTDLMPGEGTISDTRYLRMKVSGPIMTTSRPAGREARFTPERLGVEWRDGALFQASVAGTRIKADGEPYLGRPQEVVSLLVSGEDRRYVLAPWVPRWIRMLVEERTPLRNGPDRIGPGEVLT